MGIGSTGKRDDPETTLSVIRACEDALPATEFHLFGMTLSHFQDRRFWSTRIRSGDTHAWARSNPNQESGWCHSKAEKRESFHYYKGRIEQVRDEIASQGPMETASDGQDAVGYATGALREGEGACVCGRSYPVREQAEHVDDCYLCKRRALNRWDAALDRIETMETPDTVESDPDSTQASLTGF